MQVGQGNFICVHVSLVPVLGVVGEQKTKPTQHSVSVLRSLGLSPHMLACRSSEPLQDAVKEKLVTSFPIPTVGPAVRKPHIRPALPIKGARRGREKQRAAMEINLQPNCGLLRGHRVYNDTWHHCDRTLVVLFHLRAK